MRITVSLNDKKVIDYITSLKRSHKNVSKFFENAAIEALKDEDLKEEERIERILRKIIAEKGLLFSSIEDENIKLNQSLNNMFDNI